MTTTMPGCGDEAGRLAMRRRRCCRRVGWGSALPLGTVLAAVWTSRAAAQQDSPVDGATPSSTGMPGGELVRQILGWGLWLGLGACALAIMYGGATWAGFASASAGRAQSGKSYVIGGLIGAAVLGLTPTLVTMMFNAGT